MSPEQMGGQPLDGRSDVYSLGITLYQALSGRLPQAGEYVSISDSNEAIPPAIDEIIQACLVIDKAKRISSMLEFIQRLQSSLGINVPLSQLLTDARLHDVVSALSQLSQEEFHAKPSGQKLLVITRLRDLVRSDEQNLRSATAQLLSLLVYLAALELEKNYSFVVDSGYEWAFQKQFSTLWSGDENIRLSLIRVSKTADKNAHNVLSRFLLEKFDNENLASKSRWYLHDLRLISMALLANQNCGEHAERLADFYDKLNAISHTRHQD